MFDVGVQAVHSLPSLFAEKFVICHPVNGVNFLHRLQNCLWWLEAISWGVAKNQRNPNGR